MVSVTLKPRTKYPVEFFTYQENLSVQPREMLEYSNPIVHLELSVAGCISHSILEYISTQELLTTPFTELSVRLSAKRILISVRCEDKYKSEFEKLVKDCFICSLLSAPKDIDFK